MKFLNLAMFLVAISVTLQAHAACDKIKGNYNVFGQEFDSENVSESWGTMNIGDALESTSNCIYSIKSNVNTFASPVISGFQKLVISKTTDDFGDLSFRLIDLTGVVSGSGSYSHGIHHLTLSVSSTGCGGEGSFGNCGNDIILKQK